MARSELETRTGWIEEHLQGAVVEVERGVRSLATELTTADGAALTEAREGSILAGQRSGSELELPEALLSLRLGKDGEEAPSRTSVLDPDTGLCVTGGAGPLIRIEHTVSGGEWLSRTFVLTAHVNPSHLLPAGARTGASSSGGGIAILDRASGVVVSTPPCDSDSALNRKVEAMAAGETGTAISVAGNAGPGGSIFDERTLASVFDVPGTRWRVLTTADAVPASLVSLQITHLLFFLVVGIGSALVFTLLVGRWLRSLDELRDAARRIGEGDLAPWLPPPGDDEVGWLSVALGRMADRITHMVRRIDQTSRLEVAGVMASHLAHELRTPLSSIRLNLQGLSRELDEGRLPPDCEPNVRISLREVSRLEKTVSTVLQVAGGRSGTQRRATLCSVHRNVEEASRLLGDVFRETGVEIVHDLRAEADTVRADEGRLRGVFMNLLINASEAMPEGGTITVESRLFLDHEGEHAVALSVSDTGPGISEEAQDEIFNPFFTTKAEGSGIGLPMALRSVREEGGDLFLAESRSGRGARFVVVLPTAEDRHPSDANGHSGSRENGIGPGGRWARSAGSVRELRFSKRMGASAETGPIRVSRREHDGGS